jgi:hypothetical protein
MEAILAGLRPEARSGRGENMTSRIRLWARGTERVDVGRASCVVPALGRGEELLSLEVEGCVVFLVDGGDEDEEVGLVTWREESQGEVPAEDEAALLEEAGGLRFLTRPKPRVARRVIW